MKDQMEDSLPELSPVISIADKQDPHAAAHNVTCDTPRSIRGSGGVFLKKLLRPAVGFFKDQVQ